jgi:hypothetical protein
MEEINLKKIILNTLGYLTVASVFVSIIQFIIYLIWNTAVVWAIPQMDKITYLVSLGIAMLFCFTQYFFNFWTTKIILIRKTKSVVTLDLIEELHTDIVMLQAQLVDQGVLTVDQAFNTKSTP